MQNTKRMIVLTSEQDLPLGKYISEVIQLGNAQAMHLEQHDVVWLLTMSCDGEVQREVHFTKEQAQEQAAAFTMIQYDMEKMPELTWIENQFIFKKLHSSYQHWAFTLDHINLNVRR